MKAMPRSESSAVVLRPSSRDLGVHRLFFFLLALNAMIAVVTVPFYGSFGLTIDWQTFAPSLAAIAFAALGWLAHRSTPGRASEWPIAETFVAFTLIALCFSVVTPAQYLAVALKRPLVDPWLARADAFLGISVPDAVAWTRQRPGLASILALSYYSLAPQFVAPLVILGLYYRDRYALWEYTFNFHICLAITLLGLALFPAACAFTYYGFESLIDQTRFTHHFDSVRNGTFTKLQLRELEGLITFPSFHVAGGLMVTWAFRRYRVLFIGFAALNALMIASTVFLGPHYLVDIFASAAVFAASAWAYSRWAYRLAGAREAAGLKNPEGGGAFQPVA
jgi:membrane-associated phospholipid phosphatase